MNRSRTIDVAAAGGKRWQGMLAMDRLWAPCALGRSGIRRGKREGDGATPAGSFRLVMLMYRPDRKRRPKTGLPVLALRPDAGWCDDPADRRYNRPVRLPYPASHERLWRDDGLYDLVVVLDYNFEHPQPGRGSAIFLHLASPGFGPTAGCVAVSRQAMTVILARSDEATMMTVR